MRRLALAFVLFLSGFSSGCGMIQAPVVPPTAFFFTSIDAPLDIDFQATAVGKKRGESSAFSVLWIVSVGDASSAKAAQNGGISTIRSADYHFVNVLGGLFTQFTTIVRGD